jgi:hypothetical protein
LAPPDAAALDALVELGGEAAFGTWLKKTGQPETSFRRGISRLKERGFVEHQGSGRGGRYVITEGGRRYRHEGGDRQLTTTGGHGGEDQSPNRQSPPQPRRGGGDGGGGGGQGQRWIIPGRCPVHGAVNLRDLALGLTEVGDVDTPRWQRKCACARIAARQACGAAKSSPAAA